MKTSFQLGGAQLGGAAMPDYATSSAPAAAPATNGSVIKDVSTQTFMDDVIEASKAGPVVVDFWAPWCGPCKQLGPVIEKVVSEAGGRVTLAKMDIEKYPEVAGQMGIQSIPAVVAFVDGRPAEAFMGAKPESEVRAFIDKLAAAAPVPAGQFDAKSMLDAADTMLANGDHGGAAEAYGTVAQHEPGNLDALAGLGQCYVAVGEIDTARQLLQQVPPEFHSEGAIAKLAKQIELADQAAALGDTDGLRAAVEADPADHQARLDYAVALNAHGQRNEAVDQLIAIVKADREWNEDGGRKQLLDFFETWGPMDKATIYGRRSLSSVLFS